MPANISLYTVNSIIFLDNDGKRLLAKYYKPPHGEADPDSLAGQDKKQATFEANLFQKTQKVNGDIILFENQIVVYKEYSDVIIYLTGGLNENEALLYTTLQGLIGALDIVLKSSIDKKSIQENYDMVSLAVDETADDGIILETDPAVIASRVTKAPTDDVNIKIDLSEKGLFNAFQFAKSKVSERLQQGF
ncbi:unnamed protein product [Kuraishia capsulata CBS 1993]|uniref:Coatomer subunit zeta n=1 Tax=Kuraishia capsulata CBS 1993 TaxID=1382522 RepID=W6MHW9_9ASCO|nr:uncharacterized protein KUCA_T00001611001 [Kuraishia capsulata CBS 1993]CDK25641.1 unnamed protein product [Kuraishia capsulata CBS 1993]